jgi:acyl-CoA dehydrogenase
MAQIIKFMPAYFFMQEKMPEVPAVDAPRHDEFMFNQGPTKGASQIRFHSYRETYGGVQLPNAEVFKKQVSVFNEFMTEATSDETQGQDLDFSLNAGEIFSLVVYGQLIIEIAKKLKLDDALLDQIFDFMVRNFSRYSLQLYSKPSTTEQQQEILRKCIMKPVADTQRFQKVWDEVYSFKDLCEMRK